MTSRDFNDLNDELKADVEFRPQQELKAMTGVEYANERRRVRLAEEAKVQSKATHIKLIAGLGQYRRCGRAISEFA
ncbi:unnamed protein product [Phytophthora lilii]|uniref:Unnamed protein product n=1 Tax=Phytophthora lilii TaxID=2077276 RepID=A0A9W6XN33_9STRA|nr:unnamed protein product [Phytophthora lilii]